MKYNAAAKREKLESFHKVQIGACTLYRADCREVLPLLPRTSAVIDPVMGAGDMGVACAKLGRKFIGIERDEKYFDMACRRIEKAYAQPDLVCCVTCQR